MQFLVPQNIDLEDKIVGPLTLKNFLILLFGGLFVYALFFILPRPLAILIAIPAGIILVAITMIKIHDQSFPTFIMHLIYFSFRPKKRTWNNQEPKPQVLLKKKVKKEEKPSAVKKVVRAFEIEKLSELVDTKGWRPISSETAEETEKLELEDRVRSKAPKPQKEKSLPDVLEVPKG